MVKIYAHNYTYDHPWKNVTLAFWLRYPNPYASHILSVDVVDRTIDKVTGILRTTRLIVKRGKLPKWGQKLIKTPVSYIIEETEVDPRSRVMISRTRNLDHTRVMQVEETQIFRANNNDAITSARTEARIRSNFGWGLSQRIEKYGITRFGENTLRSRKGMSYILDMLNKDRMNPFSHGLKTF